MEGTVDLEAVAGALAAGVTIDGLMTCVFPDLMGATGNAGVALTALVEVEALGAAGAVEAAVDERRLILGRVGAGVAALTGSLTFAAGGEADTAVAWISGDFAVGCTTALGVILIFGGAGWGAGAGSGVSTGAALAGARKRAVEELAAG